MHTGTGTKITASHTYTHTTLRLKARHSVTNFSPRSTREDSQNNCGGPCEWPAKTKPALASNTLRAPPPPPPPAPSSPRARAGCSSRLARVEHASLADVAHLLAHVRAQALAHDHLVSAIVLEVELRGERARGGGVTGYGGGKQSDMRRWLMKGVARARGQVSVRLR